MCSANNNGIKLFAIALAIYMFIVIFVSDYWFAGDEGYYSMSIYEAINNGPNIYITFFGKPAFWKPFLMVDVYAMLAKPFFGAIPSTVLYRSISALFSAIGAYFTYLISRRFVDEKKAIIATAIYMFNPIILIYGTKIFMETFAMTSVLGGLAALTTLHKNENRSARMLCIMAVTAAILGAAFGKSTTIGIMALGIYLMYSYLIDKELLVDVAIAGVISAAVIFLIPYASQFPDAYFKLYAEDFFTKRIGSKTWLNNTISTAGFMLYLLPIFAVGWKSIKRDNKTLFLLLWVAPLILIAIKTPYLWYAFYFIMPISILAAQAISLNKLDITVAFLLIMTGTLMFIQFEQKTKTSDGQKLITYCKENISKQSCILYMGAISPPMYSYLEHKGYIYDVAITNEMLTNGTHTFLDANITQKQVEQLVYDYDNVDFIDNIADREYLFATWYGKNEQLHVKTENKCPNGFDYVFITDYRNVYNISEYELVNDETQVKVWRKRVIQTE